jgi:Protein of unknown function (DUF2855)
MSNANFLVRKSDFHQTLLRDTPDLPLGEGEVRVRIDKFALTANNITYAAFGEAMNYWQFFPVHSDAGDTGDKGDKVEKDSDALGSIPVWGFGDVSQSRAPGVDVGQRIYGYFPMATSVVLQPTRVSALGFVDGAAHRAALHAVYNQYVFCASDPFYTPESEDIQALLRPLFTTAWLIDDFLASNQFFGAQQAGAGEPSMALLSSASSKTAYGTAFWLKQRAGIEVVGLTSPGNVAFCESLSCYHRVLTYEQLPTLAAERPCVYVDFAGNAALRLAIHSRFANLKYSCSIGGTHVENLGNAKDLPGPRATLFFAPAQIKQRASEWGAQEFGKRMVQAWFDFTRVACDPLKPWITVTRHTGPVAVKAAYTQVLAGRGDARAGHILSLQAG